MSRPIVCLDLDRTTIYSAAALDLTMPPPLAPRLLCVELYEGRPLSYMTEAAAAAFIALAAAAVVVPTSTRTPGQLARVRLPGPSAQYAIASNGGVLLVDGVPDPAWARRVRSRLSGCARLGEVEAQMRHRADSSFVTTLRTASELFVYAVVDRAALPDGWLAALEDWCAPRGWMVSLQGRKVYAVPMPVTKSVAAAEVQRRCAGNLLLAAGDSLLDADLLGAADAAIRPAHGELADRGFTLPHLVTTAATGVAAGEEIVRWLRDRARAGVSAGGALAV